MSLENKNPLNDSGLKENNWNLLFRLGGLASLIMVAIILIQFSVFITSPPPLDGTAIDWFELFQSNSLVGLLSFELLMVVYVILSLVLVLSFYIILRQFNQTLTLIYLVLSIVGIMSFIVARPALEMLSLSNHYASATTDAQRAIYLAAGESMLTTFHGTAFHISYVLGSICGFLISIVMLQSNIFSKTTAYLRIASSILDFGLYVPQVGMYISIFSVVFLLVWNILIARRLFQLTKIIA